MPALALSELWLFIVEGELEKRSRARYVECHEVDMTSKHALYQPLLFESRVKNIVDHEPCPLLGPGDILRLGPTAIDLARP